MCLLLTFVPEAKPFVVVTVVTGQWYRWPAAGTRRRRGTEAVVFGERETGDAEEGVASPYPLGVSCSIVVVIIVIAVEKGFLKSSQSTGYKMKVAVI